MMTDRTRAEKSTVSRVPAVIALMLCGAARGLAQGPGEVTGREAELVAPGIVRFFPFAYAKEPVPYSFALARAVTRVGSVPDGYRVSVAFSRQVSAPDHPGKADVLRHSAVVPITPGTSLYGTGGVGGPLLRNGQRTESSTGDVARGNGSWPWVLAVRPDGTAFGVLADTTFRCEIDLTTGIKFTADGPEEGFPVIVIDRDSPQEVMRGLAELAGFAALPARWVLGYQHATKPSATASKVRATASEFRRREIPCDALWIGAGGFAVDEGTFGDPVTLNGELHDAGFHTVWRIQTGVPAAPGDVIFDQGTAGDHWVRAAEGEKVRYPDFTRPQTREWWGGLQGTLAARGIEGVWIAPSGRAGGMMTTEETYRGGDEMVSGAGVRYDAVYCLLAARATREGMAAAHIERRPFVVTPGTYIGGHRYAGVWAGSEGATWAGLEESIPRVLNLGLSGQAFAGAGFGGETDDADLHARWMGVGAMLPLACGGTEPWGLGAAAERACKAALERRYRLMPYLYTLAREATLTGLPLARPVFFADARDPALRSEDDAFLIGGDVLVAPKVTPLGDRALAMPRGIWNGLPIDGVGAEEPDLPRLYVRGGAIVPLGPVMRYAGEKALDPLELVVSLDAEGRAEGFLYEDDGDGPGYAENQFLWTRYLAETRDGVVTVRLASAEGGMRRLERKLVVRLIVTNSEKLPGIAVRAGEYRAEGKEGVNVVIDVRAVK